MTERPSLLPDAPAWMPAFDGEWTYYVRGHDAENLWAVDDPAVLIHEKLWMRPVKASHVDKSDRPDDYETVRRGPDGRFESTYLWFECREGDAGAVPYMAARYA